MYLIYVDESGNTGDRRDPTQPIHLIAGLIVHESKIRPLEEAIRSVSLRHFPLQMQTPGFELHGADLFAGNAPFKGIAPVTRIQAIIDVLDALQANDGVAIWAAIDKIKNPSSRHPHHLAFQFLVERLEDHLRRSGALGLIVADENKEVEQILIDDIARYKATSTGWGYRPTEITCIVDSVHFVQSKNNLLIQAADLVAYFALKSHRQFNTMLERYRAAGQPTTWVEWKATTMSPKEKAIEDTGQRIAAITRATKLYPI